MKHFTRFKSIIILIFILFTTIQTTFGQTATVKGTVYSSDSLPVKKASVIFVNESYLAETDISGHFTFLYVPYGEHLVEIKAKGYQSQQFHLIVNQSEHTVNYYLFSNVKQLDEIEVFGNRNTQPDKLSAITRLPLKPNDQIQSISVISSKVIEQQGALTITEATRNVPGVYAFASYGNKRESMGSRGYRGIPILKNGVRVNSDFRGVGILTDASGIDNIQVLKGLAAITQGVATDIGSPGGVINIVTKTPKFYTGGTASLRVGSWGLFRPQFDVYSPLDKNNTVAIRVNGALEKSGSYRANINGERFYINPSIAWRANDKTTIILEMDYLDDSRTPDLGTVNLASEDINAIYQLPYSQFLGFTSDRTQTKNATYSARIERKINDIFSLRLAYFNSTLNIDDRGATLSSSSSLAYNLRRRSYNLNTREDKNQVLQLDLMASEFKTGSIKHTFQVGIDYNKTYQATSSANASSIIDTIDVYSTINNELPSNITLGTATLSEYNSHGFGALAQEVTSWTKWLRTYLGVRYSIVETTTLGVMGVSRSSATNPLGGIMIIPNKNINIFGSYTNASNPRTATYKDINGNALGNERWEQFEAGVKTTWFKDRLHFNVTFFKINNKDMNLPVYDSTWAATGYYQKGGDDQRQGIEIELTGRVLKNLEVIAGYSYIDARYKEHTSYVYNSRPLNTPKNTFNFYVNYQFTQTFLKGFSVGAGVYYIGDRPDNDWSSGAVVHEGMVPGVKPFDLKAYTIVNVQAAYNFNKHWNARLLINNIANEIGYNAYRTSYINQIDPRNLSLVLNYRF